MSPKQTLKETIHVGRPNVLNRDLFLSRVNQILDSKQFSNNGPFVTELEKRVASYLQVKHCIAVTNATIGLELVLSAMNLSGQVITPSFTFIATANAISRVGLEPVFCDVADNGLIDPSKVESLISSDTKAILAVNSYGNVCDVVSLEAIARLNGLKLIFDSAHGLGVSNNGQKVGGFGDAEVFSLHATKFITGFEGGLITTNNDVLANKLKLVRNFGFTGYEKIECQGTNAKLSEIHAAMALTNLEHIDEIVQHNKRNYEAYKSSLPSEFSLLEFPESVDSNFQYIVTRTAPVCRDFVVEYLHENQILVRKYFSPGAHMHVPYNKKTYHLPVTDAWSNSVICFPTGQDIDVEIIKEIAGLAKEAVSEFRTSK